MRHDTHVSGPVLGQQTSTEPAVRLVQCGNPQISEDPVKSPIRECELRANVKLDFLDAPQETKVELAEILNISESDANRQMVSALEAEEGLLGNLYKYLASTGSDIVPELAASTSIFAIALLGQRKWLVESADKNGNVTKTDLNIYLFNSAYTGAGKSFQMRTLRKLFESVADHKKYPFRDVIFDLSKTSSGQALQDRLRRFPSMGILVDEFHRFIESSTGSKTSQHRVEFINLMLEMSDNAPIQDRTNLSNSTEQSVEIPHASMSIFASTVPQGIDAISRKSDLMNDGFINRFLYVPSHLPFIKPYAFSEKQRLMMAEMMSSLISHRVGPNWSTNCIPVELSGMGNYYGYYLADSDDEEGQYGSIRTYTGGLQKVRIHDPEANFSRITVDPKLTCKMQNLLDAMRSFGLWNQRPDTPDQPEYLGVVRASKQFTKLAGLCALSSWAQSGCVGEPIIGEREYLLAKCFLSVSTAGMRTIYGTAAGSLSSQTAREEADAINKCLLLIRHKGVEGYPHSPLLRKMGMNKNRFSAIIQTLQESDDIRLTETRTPRGGPSKRIYFVNSENATQ